MTTLKGTQTCTPAAGQGVVLLAQGLKVSQHVCPPEGSPPEGSACGADLTGQRLQHCLTGGRDLLLHMCPSEGRQHFSRHQEPAPLALHTATPGGGALHINNLAGDFRHLMTASGLGNTLHAHA